MEIKDQGREVMAFHAVRNAVVTASATLTTGTATSLVSGDADYFLDLVEVTLSTNSTVALGSTASAKVDLINDGTILRTVYIPEGNPVQLQFDVPVRQLTKNTPWNVDMEDVTGTTVSINATFIKHSGK